MATKLTNLRLSELSLVDSPANKAATVSIFKRDYTDDERKAMAEKGDALPDGSYPIKTSADLANAIQSFGRANNKPAVKAHIVRRAKALNAVDKLPEDWNVAKVDAIAKAVAEAAAVAPKTFAQTYADAKRSQVSSEMWPIYCALQDSVSSIIADSALDNAAQMDAIRQSVDGFLSTVSDKVPDVSSEIGKLFTDPALRVVFLAGMTGDPVSKKDNLMPDDIKKVADLEKSVAELTKRAETAEAVAKMADVEKAHFEKLGDADKPAFLALSKEGRSAAIIKAATADEVLYKSTDGTEFRKSDDPRLVTMAKRADEADKIAKAEREARETAEFNKRAETEIGHLPGDAAVKGQILKHLASAPEDVRKAADALLKAGDGAIKAAFDTIGVKKGGDADVQKSLDTKVAEIQKRDSISKSVAMERAVTENPELAGQLRN